MLRSHSQVLYSFLPGAVFRHEDRVYGRVLSVGGSRINALNEAVIYEEIAKYIEQWPEEMRHDLPIPRGERVNDYRIMKPDSVRWELFPLVFECSRRDCGRVHSFVSPDDLAKAPRCRHCQGPLQQLRFYNAHNCGRTRAIFVPDCQKHGYDDVFFDNTGSFLTATWRCRGNGCNGGVIQRTNMSPCNCGQFPGADGVVRMLAHTLDDTRAYQAHYIDLVNIDSSTFQDFQRHPSRGQIAIAHYLELLPGIRDGIREANTARGDVARLSPRDWAAKEAQLRSSGLLGDEDIAVLKDRLGPADTGMGALGSLPAAVLEEIASRRSVYERAAVFDRNEVRRRTLVEQREHASLRGDTLQTEALDEATALCRAMGISELAVTWEFPIAKVAFGYTRERHQPAQAALRGFRQKTQNDGKCPVYAVANETEALLVTMSAAAVIGFVVGRGEHSTPAHTEEEARRQLLSIFAHEEVNPQPAATVRVLMHTLSHLMLRGLDDGQIGFAEASLSEWLVPETLTFAIYANNLKDFTLGSLWTLISSRALSWLRDVAARSVHCENDPICYQHDPRSCERCAYLTFGCRLFNDALDRSVLYDFLFGRGVLGTPVGRASESA
jgi:hypothetical protein